LTRHVFPADVKMLHGDETTIPDLRVLLLCGTTLQVNTQAYSTRVAYNFTSCL